MSTLTAGHAIYGHAPAAFHPASRLRHLRALFARMAAASRAAADRRAMRHLNDHLLRDLGLTRGDLDTL